MTREEKLRHVVKILLDGMKEYCSKVGDWDHEELAYFYQGFFEQLIEEAEKNESFT
jgi:hypothetical protein